ncbi:MAG TPA: histidine phosphatase family protein [Ktedonobacterales bacterium]|jgi:probable phosphoglycerate mutase|nr:histidine phosphatase family protein [Ktedonobacterales bacterium]
MNTVHFVRHGENPANITREFSHRVVDYPLTERGVAQAQATARHFRGKDIAAIYASPLRRAAQTADIIAASLNLPVRTVEAFREVNVGALELQAPCEETWALHDRIFADWFSGRTSSRFPDGEDHTTLAQRMRLGLLEALGDRNGEHIIIVAHGGILAATVGTFCAHALYDERGHMPLIPNCAITRLRLEARDGDVRGVVEAWAECDHLEAC